MKSKTFAYPSLDALVTASLGPSRISQALRLSRDPGRGEFFHYVSWEDAVRMAKEGDLNGARQFNASILETVSSTIAGLPRLEPEYRLDGGQSIDIALYVKGEPECWVQMVEANPLPRKGVAVLLNVGALANVKASLLNQVGVSIASVILGLQATGHTVSLFVGNRVNGSIDHQLLFSAPVNPGGSLLDIAKLSAVIRPWFLRRILFSLRETLPLSIRDEYGICATRGYNHGSSQDISQKDAATLTGVPGTAVINMQSITPSEVKSILVDQLKERTD